MPASSQSASKTPNTLIAMAALLVMATFGSSAAHAARFANQFVEFELPPRWQCNLEGAEWVCQGQDESKKRDAIIVLAAKLKGDQDGLEQYLNFLKAPKVYQSVQGKPVRSDAKYAKQVQINGHPWVDSLHLESELPGFYTRYVATVKQDIGVLVTFSINKEKYNLYLADCENMVKTLKVFRKAGGINAAPQDSNLFANANVAARSDDNSAFPAQPLPQANPQQEPKSSKQEELPIGLILVGGAAVAYFIWRRRQDQD